VEKFKEQKTYFARSRKHWRSWLEKYHAKEKCVYLIFYTKDSDVQGVSYVDAVEEALCFGWIDSTVYKRDTVSRYQFFAKRNPRGTWSTSNKERVTRLIKQGLMTPAGQAMIDIAKQNGSWNSLNDVEKMVIPDDLQKALNKNKKAIANFHAFSPSAKKMILHRVYSAKRPETRAGRIKKAVEEAAKNIKPNQ